MKMIKFPSIDQFRSIVKNVKDKTAYKGKDENGNAIFDYTVEMPTLEFTGTPKGHGTNAGVSMNVSTGEFWAQSRENIITIEKDNAGFAFFVESHKESFISMFNIIKEKLNISDGYISIYGEWAGPGIQKGVGISKIPNKSLFIFDIKITDANDNVSWIEPIAFQTFRDIDNDIYLMSDIGYYKISINFNNPEMSQNELVKMTEDIEADCPIGKYFGVSENNVGEGIVWRSVVNGDVIRFKVKGEKHSSSKVKSLASVDVEKMKNINDFVEYAVTENRLLQGIEQVFTSNSLEPDVSMTGQFVKWVTGDIFKEEMDVMTASNLEPKDVNAQASKKASNWFRNRIFSM